MTIRLRVFSPLDTASENIVPYRLVPIRFARAVDGFTDDTAPDLDDHGFLTAGNCTAHGPVVGVLPTKTIRVQVIRDRIENASQLFVTIDSTSVATIAFPPAGTALSTADVTDAGGVVRQADSIFLTGANVTAEAETLVKVRVGAADGPVLAELAVKAYPKVQVNVQAHLVSINGVAPAVNLARFQAIFNDVNKIYAQAGIEFVLQPALANEAVVGFTEANTVTLTNVNDRRNTELQTVLRQNASPNMLNAYMIGQYRDVTQNAPNQLNVLGIAFSNIGLTPANPASGFPGTQAGITIRDSTDTHLLAHTAAHEIGHSLTLEHYANGNGSSGAVGDQRADLWAHRCLMYNLVNLDASFGHAGNNPNNRYKASNERVNIGYGNLDDGTIATGQLIMTKDRTGSAASPGIFQSNQASILRTSAQNGTCFPV